MCESNVPYANMNLKCKLEVMDFSVVIVGTKSAPHALLV